MSKAVKRGKLTVTEQTDESTDILRRIASKQGGGTSSITSAISSQTTSLQGSEFFMNVSRGVVSGMSTVNKFGRAPNGIQTTATDIWDRADSTPTQQKQIWVAPTAARVHAIVSSSASDNGSPAGVGARTLRVYGLTSWSSAETSEDITLNGTSSVNTVNSYVIIHRMVVRTAGATSINVGTITATAATDGTITAQINPDQGQTQMCIYGIPSTQTLYLTVLYAGLNRFTGSPITDVSLMYNSNPSGQTTYRNIGSGGLSNSGTSFISHAYNPPRPIAGPAIIKLQAISDTADVDLHAGFDGVLVTN